MIADPRLPCPLPLQQRLPNRPGSLLNRSALFTTQYPYTGSSVMLALLPETNYSVEVMQFGGADIRATSNLNLLACRESMRIKVVPSAKPDGVYTFAGGWVQEDMGSPRVMPDSVLLPNGMVIVMSGAKAGLAGDSASGGGSRANFPNLYAELYDPYAPLGQRWSTLANTQIARLCEFAGAIGYAGVAALATPWGVRS